MPHTSKFTSYATTLRKSTPKQYCITWLWICQVTGGVVAGSAGEMRRICSIVSSHVVVTTRGPDSRRQVARRRLRNCGVKIRQCQWGMN